MPLFADNGTLQTTKFSSLYRSRAFVDNVAN